MRRWWETVTDPLAQAERLRARRFGLIEVCRGRLVGVRLRPWPTWVSIDQVWWGRRVHRRRRGDYCWLYYNQPWGSPDYLALVYLQSTCDGSLASLRLALSTLDEVARLKQSHALVCEVRNPRLTPALLARQGWQPLTASRRRFCIKRFYGEYPLTCWQRWQAAAGAALDPAGSARL
jgi:hypothetical protein